MNILLYWLINRINSNVKKFFNWKLMFHFFFSIICLPIFVQKKSEGRKPVEIFLTNETYWFIWIKIYFLHVVNLYIRVLLLTFKSLLTFSNLFVLIILIPLFWYKFVHFTSSLFWSKPLSIRKQTVIKSNRTEVAVISGLTILICLLCQNTSFVNDDTSAIEHWILLANSSLMREPIYFKCEKSLEIWYIDSLTFICLKKRKVRRNR